MTAKNKTKPIFSVRLAVSLQLLQYLVFIVLALPLIVSKMMGYSLMDKIGLTVQVLYLFVLIAQAIGCIISFVIIRNRLKINNLRWSDLGFKPFRISKAILYIIGFYVLMFCVLILLSLLTTATGINGDSGAKIAQKHSQAIMGLWPYILATVIIGPIVEEILFRGILFKALLQKHGVVFSAVAGGLIFALMHLDPVHILSFLPLGIYACVMYRKLGSIIPGIFLHASWNLLVVFITASSL